MLDQNKSNPEENLDALAAEHVPYLGEPSALPSPS